MNCSIKTDRACYATQAVTYFTFQLYVKLALSLSTGKMGNRLNVDYKITHIRAIVFLGREDIIHEIFEHECCSTIFEGLFTVELAFLI